jgi:hypothetical protein
MRRWSNTSLLEVTPTKNTHPEPPIRLLQSAYLRPQKSEFFPMSSSRRRRRKLIIMPDSKFRVCWDVIGMAMIIYDAFYIPYICFFQTELMNDFNYSQIVKTLYFMMDIVLNFNTAFLKQGNLKTSQKLIVKNYLKHWFCLDLFATFPWVVVFNAIERPDYTIYINSREVYLLNILYLMKLLRIPKISGILFKLELVTNNKTLDITIQIVYFLVGLSLAAHYVACLFYFLPSLSEDLTWINEFNFESGRDYYLRSLYWTITTMASVGFGDINSKATSDKLTAIFGMLVCSGIFVYGIGRIENILSKHSEEENFYRNLVIQLNQYMNKINLPLELRIRVRRYINYIRSNQKEELDEEKYLLESLSEPIRQDIYTHVRGKELLKCQIFNEYPDKFIGELSKLMTNQMFAPGDVIFKQGESSNVIYFILRGRLEIYHEETKTTFRDIESGSYFGEIAFFTHKYRCASARCLEFLHVVSLTRADMDKLLVIRPSEAKLTKDIEEECETSGLGIIMVTCYLCGNPGHVAIFCEKYKIKLNKQKIIKKMQTNRAKNLKFVNPDLQLGEVQYKRRNRKVDLSARYNIRNIKGSGQIPDFSYSKDLDDISASFRLDFDDSTKLYPTPVPEHHTKDRPAVLDEDSIEL